MAIMEDFVTNSVSGRRKPRRSAGGGHGQSQARIRRSPVAQRAWRVVCIAALLLVDSCAAPSVKTAERAESPTVAAIDPERAYLLLDAIEPRPVPAQSPVTEEHVSPAPALRYVRQGRRDFEERLWTSAITAFEKALKLDPQLVEARILLARAAMRQGNQDWAESHLREALKQRPNDVAANQLLGEIAWRANRSEEAIRHFRLALISGEGGESRPETVLAHLSLAMALRKEGYLTASIGQLKAYLAAVSDPTEAMSRHEELKEVMVLYRGTAAGLLGEIHSQLGQHEAAVVAYRRAAAEAPADASVKDRLARSLANAGRSEEALEVVYELLANSQSQVDGLQLLSDVCTLLGDADRYDAAIARLATEATNPVLQRRLAGVLEERGKTDAAISVLERLTRTDPAQLDAVIQLAGLYLEARRWDDFLETVGRVALDEGGPSGRADTLLTEAGSNAELRADFLRASEQRSVRQPDEPAAQYVYGRLLVLDGRIEVAVDRFQQAVRLAPKSASAAAALAEALITQKRWEEAVTAASEAIERDVRTAEVFLAKGRAMDALDKREEAEAAYMEALRLDRKSVECRLLLAKLAERRGNIRQFLMIHRQVIEDVDPRCVESREALVRLYLGDGRIEQAKEVFSGFERLGLEGAGFERCRARMDRVTQEGLSVPQRNENYRTELQRIIEAYPEEIATRVDLARTYEESSDYELCLQQVEAAVRISPDDIEARILMARTLTALLRYDGAEATWLELLKDRPRNLAWQLQLVELARNRGDFDGAASRLKEMIEWAKQESLAEVLDKLTDELVQELARAGRAEEAAEIARSWLEDAPEENYRRALYLSVLNAAEQDDEAVTAARGWLDDDPTSSVLRRYLLQCLMATDRNVEAQQEILQWLVDDPDNDGLTVELLDSLLATKEWESALDITRCSAEVPDKRDAYLNMVGRTLLASRQFDAAIDHYHSIINDIEESNETEKLRGQYRNLITALIVAERYDEAENVIHNLPQEVVLQRALRGGREPAVNEFVQFLISIYQRTDREDQAMRFLEEMHKPNPTDAGMCNDLGYTWVDAGLRLEEAEKLIRTAVAAEPRNPAFLDSLGWVHYKRGRMTEAVKYLELALRHLGGDDEVMRDHLGDAYYRNDRKEDARLNWDKALKRLGELEEGGFPLNTEQRELREDITRKLEELDRGAPVETAPIGERSSATSRSAA